MELNKNIKQAFSSLQNQIIDPSEYILITQTRIIFKNNICIKDKGTWVNSNSSEPLEVLSDVGLGNNVNSIIEENNELKKKIEELNLKIVTLEQEQEKDDDENDDDDDDDDDEQKEVFAPKKKVSGRPASQNKIKKVIVGFFNHNKADSDLELEDFSEFSSIILNEDNAERINILREIINEMKGGASESVYKSFIKLEILLQLYKENYGEKKGKLMARDDLSKIITTKKRPSMYFKKASNFHFICKHLKKGTWKECEIAPTYWESVTSPTWNDILTTLNLEQQSEDSE